MLKPGSHHFIDRYETHMYGGNAQWANPEDARNVGRAVGTVLIERHDSSGAEADRFPEVHKAAADIFADALRTVNYAALPTERRANILHGLVDVLAESGVLGGEPEWVSVEEQGVENV